MIFSVLMGRDGSPHSVSAIESGTSTAMTGQDIDRRRVAILTTDVVGCNRPMRGDEVGIPTRLG